MAEDSAEDRDERIRRRAYELWQREGAPEGRDQAHWHEAVAQIDAEDAAQSGVAPGTAAAAGLAGRGDDLPKDASGLDEMDVQQAREAMQEGRGEQVGDTTPATGGKRKRAAAKTEPGAAPKRAKKTAAAKVDKPAKAGAAKGGHTVAPGEKKVSRRAVRSGPEKSADAYSKKD
ncbi:DUF2934 domain-containing protein [Limimaricola pyoseonensis]|uniref:DUF2934 domain-containing protein n=1 Tax=Limimaricola pyoseonensis TaxID=521013 RepID=A0A1G7J4E2_9RHOB|nr:DUF2934 domain-containing protein [Limimaricola pyoseonensis]SDF19751.1 Protein of unknown function [Limimaricola pyoseonensis]